jgi:hypothetical protein
VRLPLDGGPRHPLEIARDHLDDAVPVLTGDPMTTSMSFVVGSIEQETFERLTDDELLRRAAREVAKVICMIAKIMLVKATLSVTRPAEIGVLVRALAQVSRPQLRSWLGTPNRVLLMALCPRVREPARSFYPVAAGCYFNYDRSTTHPQHHGLGPSIESKRCSVIPSCPSGSVTHSSPALPRMRSGTGTLAK